MPSKTWAFILSADTSLAYPPEADRTSQKLFLFPGLIGITIQAHTKITCLFPKVRAGKPQPQI